MWRTDTSSETFQVYIPLSHKIKWIYGRGYVACNKLLQKNLKPYLLFMFCTNEALTWIIISLFIGWNATAKIYIDFKFWLYMFNVDSDE